jgi:hypothetical protein
MWAVMPPEAAPHTQFCACDSCRFRRRKIRFETVSRATYDPDRKLVEIVPEAEPEPRFEAGPVFADEVTVAAVTEFGVVEPAPLGA